MIEQFIAIINQEDEQILISFLQSLTEDQKKKLSPGIKKLAKEYSQFGLISSGTYGHTNGSNKQRNLVQLASFVCFNYTDYEKSPYSIWTLQKDTLNKIIHWYCPSWFSDFVNKQSQLDFIPYYLDYEWIMELTEREFLKPTKELLVKIIPPIIFESDSKNIWHFKPENVLERKVTVESHLWYLFELESNIHYSDRYLKFGGAISRDKTGWVALFKGLIKENRVDRSRVLKESLLAGNRNFNKVLSGWFSQMFIELEPTPEELLALQNELFSTLSSTHSKVVNTSLLSIKRIITERDFNVNSFLDNVPLLLSSDTKATITSGLMILEKLAQKNKEYREKICLLVCQTFIKTDDELQSRAAKIIEKFADTTSPEIRQEIADFYSTMMTTTRKTLVNYYDNEIKITKSEGGQSVIIDNSSEELIKMKFPENIDDLVFLASQAFDNNEPWHIDILLASIVKYCSRLTSADIPRFEPSFQRAFGLIKNPFRSTTGHLDHLLAFFFIDFGNWIMREYPESSETIGKIYRKHDKNDEGKIASWTVSPETGFYTAIWDTHSKISFYEPYKILMLEVLNKIEFRNELPILCTPNLLPCWISPEILINRLHTYQQAGQLPGEMDLQIAISRCRMVNSLPFVDYAIEKLTGEFRELMIFLLGNEASPKGPFHHPTAWMVASLAKKDKRIWAEFEHFSYYKEPFSNYTGELNWESKEENYSYNKYNYQSGKNELVNDKSKQLRVIKVSPEKENGLKRFVSKILPRSNEKASSLLYEFIQYNIQYLGSESNDIKRILSLVPNNPEPIIRDTINKCLKYSTFWEEGDKKMVISVLQYLHEIWNNPGDMAHLFLGTCMLSSDKTAASIAAEIWLKAVLIGEVNNTLLGKIIGLHERIEFAPLKRFTDLVNQNMWRVSDLHNQALKKIIENILLQLADTNIRNLKKLKEINAELNSM